MSEPYLASPRYTDEILAWEYDQRNGDFAAGELVWYLHHAASTGEPILELACGSGRLLLPIAEAGYQIDGIDSSEAMLARLRARAEAYDSNVQDKVRVFCAGMLAFVPDRAYAMVFIALNSLQYLETQERIRTCFRRVHTFLKPGGLFLFMIQRIDPHRYGCGEKVVIDWMANPVVDPERGISVGSKFVYYIEPGGERLVKERTYQIADSSGASRTLECVTFAPILGVPDYLSMLEQAGFASAALDGYTDHPYDGTGKSICFRCEKR